MTDLKRLDPVEAAAKAGYEDCRGANDPEWEALHPRTRDDERGRARAALTAAVNALAAEQPTHFGRTEYVLIDGEIVARAALLRALTGQEKD